MVNSFKAIVLLMLIVVLVGCGKTDKNVTPDSILEEASVVLLANEQQLLADATMWTLTDKTKVRSRIGEKITVADIQAGDLISYKSEGPIMESYPMQGTLGEVTLFNDEISLKISSAISSFLANQTEGDIVEFALLSIEENTLSAEIKLWNLEADQRFLVNMNIDTNDFSLTEMDDLQDE